MSRTANKSTTSTDTKNVKQELILEVDRNITKSGKSGTIIWIGDNQNVKTIKVRWSDGSIEFFTEKELQ